MDRHARSNLLEMIQGELAGYRALVQDRTGPTWCGVALAHVMRMKTQARAHGDVELVAAVDELYDIPLTLEEFECVPRYAQRPPGPPKVAQASERIARRIGELRRDRQ
ncbi:MAG: hypothetical protein ABSC46_02045 [Candidatus Limnocylindrales bacterium]|jgi:hypothetical protein